jgi:prepilin-type N-terminal cleavage/methylation domain-containing protein
MDRPKTNHVTGERMLRQVGGQRGFTLIEVIFYIVLVAVFMAAIGLPFLHSLSESDVPEVATIAYFLAVERLEELAAQTTGSIADEARAAVAGYGGGAYEREVVVIDLNCDDLATPESGSGCRQVTVTVYHDRLLPNAISVVELRTAY